MDLPPCVSRATPWAFMETSMAVLKAPKTTMTAASARGSGASSGSTVSSGKTSPAAMTMRRLETRTSNWPVTCWEMRAPSAAQKSTRPISVAVAPRSVLMPGMAATQVPTTAPLTTKMRKVARRGDIVIAGS